MRRRRSRSRSGARSRAQTCPGCATASARCSRPPGPTSVACCDVGGVAADAVTVDALARLQLAARRHGCGCRLRGASDELRGLVAFMGLADVLRRGEPGLASSRGGSPNSGKSVSVPRKNVSSAIPPSRDLDHLERPRLEAVAASRGLVLAERRRAVGRHRGDHARAARSRRRGRATRRRCRRGRAATARTGGIDWVASSWISDVSCVDVVGLERVDVARRAGRGRRRPACGAGLVGVTPVSSSVARARCSALLTEATLVSSSSATSAAFHRSTSQQDQHGALAGRQVLQRRDERQPDRLARLRHRRPGRRRRRRARRGSARSTSSRAGSGRSGRPGDGRAEVHRPGAALRPLEHVQADVRRDPVEPRAQRGAALEAGRARARRAAACPGRRPRPRTASRASGSSSAVSSRAVLLEALLQVRGDRLGHVTPVAGEELFRPLTYIKARARGPVWV